MILKWGPLDASQVVNWPVAPFKQVLPEDELADFLMALPKLESSPLLGQQLLRRRRDALRYYTWDSLTSTGSAALTFDPMQIWTRLTMGKPFAM